MVEVAPTPEPVRADFVWWRCACGGPDWVVPVPLPGRPRVEVSCPTCGQFAGEIRDAEASADAD